MRVCDRCRAPRELVAVMPDAMTSPIELCPRCVSDFFSWVVAGPSGRKPRREQTSVLLTIPLRSPAVAEPEAAE